MIVVVCSLAKGRKVHSMSKHVNSHLETSFCVFFSIIQSLRHSEWLHEINFFYTMGLWCLWHKYSHFTYYIKPQVRKKNIYWEFKRMRSYHKSYIQGSPSTKGQLYLTRGGAKALKKLILFWNHHMWCWNKFPNYHKTMSLTVRQYIQYISYNCLLWGSVYRK